MSEPCNTTSVRGLILQHDQLLVEYFAPLSIAFLPGGQVQGSENLHDTLDRELREELTNCEFEICDYLGKIACFWTQDEKSNSCLNHFFEVKLGPEVNIHDIQAAEPNREVRWLSIRSGAMSSLTPPVLASLIEKRINGETAEWDLIDKQ